MSGTVRGGLRPRPLLWLAGGCASLLVVTVAAEYHSAQKLETRLSQSSPAGIARLHRGAAAPADVPPAGLSPSPARIGQWTQVALARPLFSRSRRPSATAVAGPREPRLAGVVLGGRGGARAIFAGDGDARGTIAAVGQQAGDWRVLSIAAGGVQVAGPAGLRLLHPSRDGNRTEAPALPEHPSILDLLRARNASLGNAAPSPFGLQP